MIFFMILAILPQSLLSFATWGATTAAADAPTAAASTATASGKHLSFVLKGAKRCED